MGGAGVGESEDEGFTLDLFHVLSARYPHGDIKSTTGDTHLDAGQAARNPLCLGSWGVMGSGETRG